VTHQIRLQVTSQTSTVDKVSAQVHALGQDFSVPLEPTPCDASICWSGTEALSGEPRFLSVRLTCEDEAASLVCYDGLHFTDSLESSEIAIALVPRPDGVWGLTYDTTNTPPLSFQFAWGLVITAIAGLLFLRRLQRD